MQKHRQGSLVPQHIPKLQQETTVYINKDAAQMYGWQNEGNNANPFVSIRYVQHDFECFSSWSKQEMKSFWEFIEKISSVTWQEVLNQSGKGVNKAGFGYTPMDIKKYPKSDFKKKLDPQITLFELRVTQKSRVHCFRNGSVCYVCWLDKNHIIFP